jgi:hypothetical protein
LTLKGWPPREQMSNTDPLRLLDAIAPDRDLVLHFFTVFSRFEFALKRIAKYLAGNEKEAKANWDEYAKAIRGRFSDMSGGEFSAAVTYLTANPPKKQTVAAGVIRWRDSVKGPGESNEAFILRLVRTVRNNLFHGGKYPEGPIDDVARNRLLLQASIRVLLQCLDISPEVKQWYYEVE